MFSVLRQAFEKLGEYQYAVHRHGRYGSVTVSYQAFEERGSGACGEMHVQRHEA